MMNNTLETVLLISSHIFPGVEGKDNCTNCKYFFHSLEYIIAAMAMIENGVIPSTNGAVIVPVICTPIDASLPPGNTGNTQYPPGALN